ncbi:MAG: high frequency lysogenization protein [Parasphingorhabdus sp.]|jgi:high frequency lysogenization protein
MPTSDQVLSLAAVSQCCQLVHQLATRGFANVEDVDHMVAMVLDTDPVDVSSLVGGAGAICGGLTFVRDLNAAPSERGTIEVARMALSTLQLQKTVRRNSDIESELGKQVDELCCWKLQEPFDLDAFSRIDNVYQKCISELSPKIVVRGSQNFLKDPEVVHKVRSLLLAAVRCAYLWFQTGGRIWHLVIMRKRYRQIADNLVRESISPV